MLILAGRRPWCRVSVVATGWSILLRFHSLTARYYLSATSTYTTALGGEGLVTVVGDNDAGGVGDSRNADRGAHVWADQAMIE